MPQIKGFKVTLLSPSPALAPVVVRRQMIRAYRFHAWYIYIGQGSRNFEGCTPTFSSLSSGYHLSMPPFDITAAQIVGLFMESVFYGKLFLMFLIA